VSEGAANSPPGEEIRPAMSKAASSNPIARRLATLAFLEAGRLVDEGRWSSARDAELAAAFESAAREALSRPSLAERSPRLRRVARVVVPARFRPMLGRVARGVDATLRKVLR
jgi:hypothetical protein